MAKQAESQDPKELIQPTEELLRNDPTSQVNEGKQNLKQWMTLLESAEFEGADEMRSQREELQELLGAKNPDPATLAEVLNELGDATQESAEEAQGMKTILGKLASSLHSAAKSLDSETGDSEGAGETSSKREAA